jgi:hypothetical protein
LGAAGGDLYDGAPTTFGLQFEPVYVGPAGGMFWYGGLLVGFLIVSPDTGDSLGTIAFGAQGGLLIPLNDWVAIDLGLHIEYGITNTEPDSTQLSIPVGALGVRGYF